MNNSSHKTLIIITSVIITFACVMLLQPKGINTHLEEEIVLERQIEAIELIPVNDKTTFTAYTLSVQETDSSPCIGSANNNLCELRPILREQGITICASRDLPLNTIIYIEGFGECKILDRMNIRYKGTNRVDILFDSREEALKFGKRELNYVIIK